MEYDREDARAIEPKERIKNFNEFHIPLSKERQQIQGARCMNCGVPFCQAECQEKLTVTLLGETHWRPF